MNGSIMWLFWLSFADASIRLSIVPGRWTAILKSVVLGLVADALFRVDRPPPTRLKIARYRADDPNLRAHVLGDFAPLAGDDLLNAVIGLGREAWPQQAVA